MNSRNQYSYFIEVAADMKLALADLPMLIANAVRHTDDKKEPSSLLLANIKLELTDDVQQGKLVIYHPDTLAAYSPPVPKSDIDHAVIIPQIGLDSYLSSSRGIELRIKIHGLGPNFWTFYNAATSIQKAAFWEDKQKEKFLSHLLEQAKKGEIPVFEPKTLKPYSSPISAIQPNSDLVYAPDVWDCFCLDGFIDDYGDDFRWPGQSISSIDAPLSLKKSKPWITQELKALPGLFTYQQAACEIAEEQNWDDGTFQDFLLDMAQAINQKDLIVYKPKTGITAAPETQPIWFVSVKGVNEWLEKKSIITYRWVHGSHSESESESTMLTSSVNAAPARDNWRLKTKLERAPGYRWPLYQVLKAAHIAGEPCPTARHVLEMWRKNTPHELQIMTDGVKYNTATGEQREADLKAISKCIQGLLG